MADRLAVVMPVYNEQDAIENVIVEWSKELDKYNIDYTIFAYNDGSKDKTSEILHSLEKRFSKLKCVDKKNSGHGNTILTGYREASKDYDWIFQTDSDNEMGVDGFHLIWDKRNDYDYLYCMRNNRIQPLARKIISIVSRLTIKLFYGFYGVYDVNSPYRLMRVNVFKDFYNKIPDDTFAPNVIISGFIAKNKIKFYETKTDYTPRATGEVSIKKWKLACAAVKSFIQTIKFSFKKVK